MNYITILYTLFVISISVGIIILIRNSLQMKHTSPDDFLGLLTILSSQIKSELDSYDQDIFEKKGAITNNNFDVYYRDITSRIIKNISPDLIKELTHYYTEDAVYRFIGRSVRDYLVSKINGTT